MLEELEDRHNVVQDEVASSNVDTHGFVGADIQALINLALVAAKEERIDICMEHFRSVKSKVKSKVKPKVKPSAMREVMVEVLG